MRKKSPCPDTEQPEKRTRQVENAHRTGAENVAQERRQSCGKTAEVLRKNKGSVAGKCERASTRQQRPYGKEDEASKDTEKGGRFCIPPVPTMKRPSYHKATFLPMPKSRDADPNPKALNTRLITGSVMTHFPFSSLEICDFFTPTLTPSSSCVRCCFANAIGLQVLFEPGLHCLPCRSTSLSPDLVHHHTERR